MKKIGLIALALVLSLGAMGVGLAQWTETLNINGSVATGELDICFVEEEGSISCCDYADVCSVTYEDGPDEEPGDSPVDMSKATIAISNAYPCCTCTVWFRVLNNGTIPAHLTVNVVSSDPELGVSISDDPTCTNLAVGAFVDFDVTVHVNDTAEELTTYSFTVEVVGDQVAV